MNRELRKTMRNLCAAERMAIVYRYQKAGYNKRLSAELMEGRGSMELAKLLRVAIKLVIERQKQTTTLICKCRGELALHA